MDGNINGWLSELAFAPVDYNIRLEGVTLKGLAEHGQSQSVASARPAAVSVNA